MLILAAVTATEQQMWLTLTLVIGLLIFGAVFAVNSSLHSYLILTLAKAERVMMDVGFTIRPMQADGWLEPCCRA